MIIVLGERPAKQDSCKLKPLIDATDMKKVILLTGIILLFFLALFGIATASGVPIAEFSENLVKKPGIAGMALSALLLIADVFLPVPSSLIMIMNGALYGPWLGSILSLVGGTGAAAAGYWLGRSGQATVLRWLSKSDLDTANRFYKRWGLLTVIASRPVPLLAETVSVMAGLSQWGLTRTLLSSAAGLLPVVVIYAFSGYYAAQNDYGVLSFLLVVGIAAAAWLVGHMLQRKTRASTITDK